MTGVAVVTALELAVAAYFVALTVIYVASTIVAAASLGVYRRRLTPRELEQVMRSPATPGISLICAAYNEAPSILDSVRSFLTVTYPSFEVIIVNDGSTDETLTRLVEGFDMVAVREPAPGGLPTRPVRGVYRSAANPGLLVVDKVNGRRGDALNAALNFARYPLVAMLDADSLVEPEALLKGVLPFVDDPRTVAAGGTIRIANGARIEGGRLLAVGLPRNRWSRFAVVEYARAFLAGRMAHARLNGLLIISGAFGIFDRRILLEAGGFERDTVGEDMDVVMRIHRHLRAVGRSYRIAFVPDAVCWTETPETLAGLATQRRRWQRGLLEVLAASSGAVGRPRHGVVGLVMLPYYVVFEAMAPVVEIGGYVVTIVAAACGWLDWHAAAVLLGAVVVSGTIHSAGALLLDELCFGSYTRWRDLWALVGAAIVENFGYRQLTAWWRLRGIADYLRGRRGWGSIERKGLSVRGALTGRC
jgi:cellulose synthase/poly-beta-1,6-N-acetylglucosamine synthase-like glycosyltransferase